MASTVVTEQVENGRLTLRVQDRFVPTRKQQEFFAACADPVADEILYDGSIRAGKTQACIKQMVAWAWRYGGRYAVLRKTYPELHDSTMAVMIRGEGGLPPGCPPELVKEFRSGDKKLILLNGAEVLFRNLESAEEGRAKLRNISLNAFFIDQVEELDGEEWSELYEELLGRLSDPRGPQKALLAANPGPTDHWVYKRFIDPERSVKLPWTRYVHCTLYDNEENLDPKYFAGRVRTKESNPEYYKRMVLGEWGAFGGKRFKVWDRKLHVVDPFPIQPWWEVLEGLDYGHQHPFCTLVCVVDELERYTIVGEHYAAGWTVPQHAVAIKQMRNSLGVDPVALWADPTIFHEGRREQFESVAMELMDNGLYPAMAQRDRLGGWARIEAMLATMIEGVPQLRVWSTCTNLIRELPNARYAENSDDIVKRNDHALDACRYIVASRPPVPIAPDSDQESDRRSVYAARKLQEALEGELAPALRLS